MQVTLCNADRLAIRNLSRLGLAPADIARELELPEYLVMAGINFPWRSERRPDIFTLPHLPLWK